MNNAGPSTQMPAGRNKTCPSSHCSDGAILLGVVGPQGVIYRGQRTRVDAAFVEAASQIGTPEKRFRFANKCVECGCKQWANGKCNVIETVMGHYPDESSQGSELPKCSIRDTCRWFSQAGRAACMICPRIVTDCREDIAQASG